MSLKEYVAGRLQERKMLLMTHVIVGYPSLEANWRMLEIMAANDVDLVELQMPFSEPVADGPTFARANQLAIEAGATTAGYFDFLARSASTFEFPHLMMGYYNPVFRLGHEGFCQRLSECGAQGFILPDLPFEEYGDLEQCGQKHGQEPILLMTPTSTPQRLAAIAAKARGFVYAVARKGVTGKRTDFGSDIADQLAHYRAVTDLPLALGFGLRRGDDLRQLHGQAEIGIVGSALLDCWEEKGAEGYEALVAELAQARYSA
jgi:tryptophan synthase alpha chain